MVEETGKCISGLKRHEEGRRNITLGSRGVVQKKGSVEGRRWFEKQSFSDTKHWREEWAKVATMDGASDRPIS